MYTYDIYHMSFVFVYVSTYICAVIYIYIEIYPFIDLHVLNQYLYFHENIIVKTYTYTDSSKSRYVRFSHLVV